MRRILILFCLLAAISLPASAASRSQNREIRNEFFIVSEVNLPKHQLVLELPTQSTLVMDFNGKTSFLNRSGHRAPLAKIRAGDTVFVTYLKTAKGSLATKIRSGSMTVRMLHERYWAG